MKIPTQAFNRVYNARKQVASAETAELKALWEQRLQQAEALVADYKATQARYQAACAQIADELLAGIAARHAFIDMRPLASKRNASRVSATMKRKGITPQRNMLNKGV